MLNRRVNRKRFLGGLAAVAPLAVPFSCRAAESYTMRLSTDSAATHPFSLAGIQFARAVNRRSNGQVKIEVYPSGQLVAQQATVDALRSGVLDFSVAASATLVPVAPRIQVFDTPFMFKDLNAVFRVLDGRIGDEFYGELESKGILPLAWGIGGFKEIETTSKTVVTLDDMKGIRVRVQAGPVGVATYQALGAIPIVIDFTETFVALQQHTVDAIDINIAAVESGKYYTLVKHVALAHHILAVQPLLGSRRNIEALPPELQRIVKEEGRALLPYWRALTIKQTALATQNLKSYGVAFTEIQRAPFRKAVEPVYAMIQSKLGGDLLDRVSRAAGN